jgi:hypothetical protein
MLVKPRQGFARDLVKAIDEIAPQDFFGEAKTIVSIGGGHLENPYCIGEKFLKLEDILSYDPIAFPAKYIEAVISVWLYRKKFQQINLEERRLLLSIDFIWEMSNTLQTMRMGDKDDVLWWMRTISKPGQKAIITDEIFRSGLKGKLLDPILNKIYNPDQEIYDRLTLSEYEELFTSHGFKIVASKEYHRGLVVFLLEAL